MTGFRWSICQKYIISLRSNKLCISVLGKLGSLIFPLNSNLICSHTSFKINMNFLFPFQITTLASIFFQLLIIQVVTSPSATKLILPIHLPSTMFDYFHTTRPSTRFPYPRPRSHLDSSNTITIGQLLYQEKPAWKNKNCFLKLQMHSGHPFS